MSFLTRFILVFVKENYIYNIYDTINQEKRIKNCKYILYSKGCNDIDCNIYGSIFIEVDLEVYYNNDHKL